MGQRGGHERAKDGQEGSKNAKSHVTKFDFPCSHPSPAGFWSGLAAASAANYVWKREKGG